MKKYILLLIITTISVFNYANNSKKEKYFPPSMRSKESLPIGPMIPKTNDFQKFWKQFYSAKNEFMYYKYAQSNITSLKIVMNFMTILPSYLALAQFYSNESSFNASTILATLTTAKEMHTYCKLKTANHKKIIDDCAKNLNPTYLQLLPKYYKKNPNPDSESLSLVNKILAHSTMQKRINRITNIRESLK